jgi:type II secretory pathway component PulK
VVWHRRVFCSRYQHRRDSGLILFVVLWSLVILSVLALSLGRSTGLDLALTRNATARVRAKALAWAGIMRAIDAIRQDSQNDESRMKDTLFQCGIPWSHSEKAREVFGPTILGEGEYEVSYLGLDDQGVDGFLRVGFQDEERRLNVNTLDAQNIFVLIHLIQLLGFDEDAAMEIAYSLFDWKDADDVISHEDYGAESEYYQDRRYSVKNQPLDSFAELLLVRGISEDVGRALYPWVTIFPKTGMFRINFDTASPLMLRALFRSRTGMATNTTITDADALVEKIITFRNGADGIAGTADDQVVELAGINANASERVLYLTTQGVRVRTSDYFRIRSIGRIPRLRATVTLEAVVRREDLSIISWRRE